MLVDTHCHLYSTPLAEDVAGVLARARTAGVCRVVVPAYDLASWEAVCALARTEGVHAALGVHPWVADQPLAPERLHAALIDCGAVAVGEIGLDGKISCPDLATQVAALRTQLAVARRVGLPVILHCRGVFDGLLALLAEFAADEAVGPANPWRGVVHAFSRGPELAERFLALGLHIAFGGAITRPGSRARQAARAVPLERIVLETDAPSIGLHGVPPELVEPQHVRDVAVALAELRAEPVDRIAEVTTENARKLFGI